MFARDCVAAFAIVAIGVAAPIATASPIVTWNFDNTPTNFYPTPVTPLPADIGTGSLTTTFPSSGISFPGGGLRLSDESNNRRSITFAFSTVGFQGLMLSLATGKNAPGFNNNQVAYSANGGADFTDFSGPYDPTGALGNSSQNLSFDFSEVSALDNNASVQIRFTLNGATTNGGQNSFDNVTFGGTALGGGGGTTPVPEPASVTVLGAVLGLGTLCARFRRKAA